MYISLNKFLKYYHSTPYPSTIPIYTIEMQLSTLVSSYLLLLATFLGAASALPLPTSSLANKEETGRTSLEV